jgi:hypothetical protein
LLELNLPPLVFTHLGTPSFFVNWASLALFAGGIETDLDKSDLRHGYKTVGTQLDIRLVGLSLHQFTVSFGYAKAFLPDGERSDEFMGSLRIPFYE